MTVAESFRRFRKEFNLSQRQVAETLGIKQPSYHVYESGTIPSANVVVRLANAYDVTTDYLLGLSDEPRPPKLDKRTIDLVRAIQAFYMASASEQVPKMIDRSDETVM